MGIVPVALVEGFGIAIALVGWMVFSSSILAWCGGIVAALASIATIGLVLQFRQPRIAVDGNQLLLFVRSGLPVRVPLEIVEGFLLGQGPSMLAGAGHDLETSTLVIKLADKAEEFQKVDVKAAIASWCNSYVTIRGTWCEPLNIDVVNRLNTQLFEVKQALRIGAAR